MGLREVQKSGSSKGAETAGQKHGRQPPRNPIPAISVVIPLYNRASTIQAAVDSVLLQTFADFELIVVDDGSTDEGAVIVERDADPRVRLVRQDRNRGANAARNAGVRHALAPIVSFLDSDDVFLPNKLDVVTAAFEDAPGLGVLIDSYRKVTRKGDERECRNPRLSDSRALLEGLFDRRIWKSTSGISVSRDAAIRAGLFDEKLKRRQDFDFLVRMVRSEPSMSTDEITWLKTYTDDSITADIALFGPSFFDFWDRHPEYFTDPTLRRSFSADLARHCGQLAMEKRWSEAAGFLRLVRKRIGTTQTALAVVRGADGLRRLRRHRIRKRR